MRVAIVGAGFGGIAAAVKLAKAGYDDVVLFERSDGPGGVWWDNLYPGCEVDIQSHAYSFSFLKYDWPRSHATRRELQEYAEHVIDRFRLRPKIRFGVEVRAAVWDDASHTYAVHTTEGTQVFDVVVSAVGLLNEPQYPTWPGLDDFSGVCFHTSEWPKSLDLSGARVAVVGTGSTAAQVVPAVAEEAAEVVVFQREPGWVEPKRERDYAPFERSLYRHVPGFQRGHRLWVFYQALRRFKGFEAGTKKSAQLRDACLRYIEETIEDPQVRAAVTPDYPWGCKRLIQASTYYRALNRPNVELVPHAVVEATPTGLVDDTGTKRPFDVLVLSTGFQATRFLANLTVTGRGGADLHERWGDRAQAFLGVTVPGFPNFFILYGPNTNGGLSIIAQLERQAEIMVHALRTGRRSGWPAVDTKPEALTTYMTWIDRQIATHASAMEAGCRNYYHSPGGKNITQWPRSHFVYWVISRLWPRKGWCSSVCPGQR